MCDSNNWIFRYILLFFCCSVLISLYSFFSSSFCHTDDCFMEVKEEIPIFSFSDGSSPSGSSSGFGYMGSFAVRGFFSDKDYVKYLIQTEYGLQVQRITSNSAAIYFNESEDVEPHLEVIYSKIGPECNHSFLDSSARRDIKYIFYLPPGSIYYDYSVDLN